MTIYNRPEDVPAWAEAGDRVQPSDAEIQEGWPLSPVPPSRQRFNWLLNFLANGVRYLMQRGIAEWDIDEDYPQYARVQNGGFSYIALVANLGIEPGTDPATWERWGYQSTQLLPRVDSLVSISVAGAASPVLTAAQYDNGIIVLTGILTGNINVILPNLARKWIFRNATTGAFTLGLKTAAGAAYALAQGENQSVFCDGNNLVAAAVIASTAVPDASTTVNGIVELATNAETIAGVDSTKAVTPASLTARISQDIGLINYFALPTAPANYLKADGAAVSRTTYSALFAALVTTPAFSSQTFTVTIASPAVFTRSAHGFVGGERLRFSTTGALPTGLNTTSDYFVEVIDENNFYVSATPGIGATRVITTGSQSGTQSYVRSYFGLGDGITTFNVPDLRGEFIRGFDDGRGVDPGHSFGSNEKGSFHSIDGGATAAVLGDRSAASGVSGQAQRDLGLDFDATLTTYPNALYGGITATSGGAPLNNAEQGYGIIRPRNVSLLACIKYQ